MFCTGCNNVDSSCIDAAVSEDISKFSNILFNTVKCTGKQIAKIVRKHFIGRYPSPLTLKGDFNPTSKNHRAAFLIVHSYMVN